MKLFQSGCCGYPHSNRAPRGEARYNASIMGTKNDVSLISTPPSRPPGVFQGIPQNNFTVQATPSSDIRTMRMDVNEAIKRKTSAPPSREERQKEMIRAYSLWAKISGKAKAETDKIIKAEEQALLESKAKALEEEKVRAYKAMLAKEAVERERLHIKAEEEKARLEMIEANTIREKAKIKTEVADETKKRDSFALDPAIFAAKERARAIATTKSDEIIAAQLKALREISSKTAEIIDAKERALANVPKIVEEEERKLAEKVKEVAAQKRTAAENSAKEAMILARKERAEAEEATMRAEKERAEAEEAEVLAKREQKQAEEAVQSENAEARVAEERVRTAVDAAKREVEVMKEKAREDVEEAISIQEKTVKE